MALFQLLAQWLQRSGGRPLLRRRWLEFFPRKTSYPSSVKSSTGIDTRHAVWSYQVVNTDIGDFAIINDGADDWFLEYEDQISDTLTLLMFSTE